MNQRCPTSAPLEMTWAKKESMGDQCVSFPIKKGATGREYAQLQEFTSNGWNSFNELLLKVTTEEDNNTAL